MIFLIAFPFYTIIQDISNKQSEYNMKMVTSI